jgi:hypothetical protein
MPEPVFRFQAGAAMSGDGEAEPGGPAPADEAGSGMHVHKPKAAHSLREFASEIAVIVLGILIALSGEQLIETLHWRHETEVMRESLRREILDNLGAAAERVMISPCFRARIAGLDRKLRGAGGAWKADPASDPEGRPYAALPVVIQAPTYAWYISGRWQTALASTTLAHMPEAERTVFSYSYRATDMLLRNEEEEISIAARLQPLAEDRSLSPSDRLAFGKDLAALDRLNVELTIDASKFIAGMRRSGLAPDAASLKDDYRRLVAEYGACVSRPG